MFNENKTYFRIRRRDKRKARGFDLFITPQSQTRDTFARGDNVTSPRQVILKWKRHR